MGKALVGIKDKAAVVVPEPEPPPGVGKLVYKPPGYPDYAGFQRVDLAGREYFEMSDSTDYLLNLGNYNYSEGIALVGGRKVVIIGGSITVTGSARAAGVGLAFHPRTANSHYHIEGVRIKPTRVSGTWQRTITDGMALRGNAGIVRVQNCLIGPISVKTGHTSAEIHPDCFQVQADAVGVDLGVYMMTGYTEYTGVMESAFKFTRQKWSHCNFVATGYSATDLDPIDIDPAEKGHTAFGMYYEGIAYNMPNLTMEEFYWAKDPAQTFQGYSPIELVTQKGAKYGKPKNANGQEYDFVTEDRWPYVSPGYV